MSTIHTYTKGTDVTCSVVFKNAAGVITDPSAVFFEFKDPSGNITTYTYPTDTQLVRDSAGSYRANVDANEPGTWCYKFYSTGTVKAADEGTFTVSASNFP